VVADQGGQQQEVRERGADAVELEYRPTVGDLTSALRARRGVSKAGRRQWWVLGAFVVLFALQIASLIAGRTAAPAPPLIGMFVYLFLIVLSPWLQARQVYRFAELQGTFRATVTDAGVVMATDNTTTSVNWVAQPRYRETRDAFVMLSPDKNAVGFTVLPKRAVRSPGDVGRLRDVLDRNTTRVGSERSGTHI